MPGGQGEDGRVRCDWSLAGSERLRAYHDEESGEPPRALRRREPPRTRAGPRAPPAPPPRGPSPRRDAEPRRPPPAPDPATPPKRTGHADASAAPPPTPRAAAEGEAPSPDEPEKA